MKFAFKFSNLLGSVYKKGTLLFTPDGNTVISPVGNRITLFDLKNNKSETLGIESRYNFTTIALSPNGLIVIAATEVGEIFLCSLISRTILHRQNLKKPIRDIKFSPDGKHFALTKDNLVFVYRTPGRQTKEYNPFVMERVLRATYDETCCLDWSSDSRVLAVGGKDMCTRLYPLDNFKNMGVVILACHTDRISGCFFSQNSLNIITISRNCLLCVWEASLKPAELISLGPKKFTLKKELPPEEDEGMENGETDDVKSEKPDGMEVDDKIRYKRLSKHFLKDAVKANSNVTITACAFHKKNQLLITGYSNGAFLLHEMPDVNLIHSLVIEDQLISAVAFNCSGDWIALGSSQEGQLVVWEWQSESFVMKQQGHFNNMASMSYSPDGQYIATGGTDGKLKIWNASSGFCFVTFTEHTSGISGVVFTQSGKSVISASLDGTVRAFDLMRYRNFRTFTSPRPSQFSCLSVDSSGEIVCAGSQDSFEIFVWSVQTGRLLEILSGHEAPVSSISFGPNKTILASVSWDKTLKLWDAFQSKGSKESIPLVTDGLTVEFRPDGYEVAVATLDGQILFFDVETAVQVGSIEGRKDLGVGRKETDLVTSKKLRRGQAFMTLCYSADGECILAAGKSKNVCIYHVRQAILMKRFEVTCNHSLDAIDDFISRRKMTEFGNIALVEMRDDDPTNVDISLPGVVKGDMSSRAFKPEVRVSCIRFSPTGRSWAATTTEGLLVYSLDHSLVFDPFDLDIDITPEIIRKALFQANYSEAILMAFRLNENDIIIEVLESIPFDSAQVISQFLPQLYVEKLLGFLAVQLEKTQHIEFYLIWIQSLLISHGTQLKNRSSSISGTLRMLQKNLTLKKDDMGKICDHNMYTLQYLLAAGDLKKRKHVEEEEEMEVIVTNGAV